MSYQKQLAEKQLFLFNLLKPFNPPNLEVYPSQPEYYRMRAEFRVWHQAGQIYFAMSPKGEKINENNAILLDQFLPASKSINQLMPKLLEKLNQNTLLKNKLFQIEFLDSLNHDMLISLIYHQKLSDDWIKAAEKLSEAFNISIIGRSRKQKIIIGKDYICEKLSIHNKSYFYHQYEQSFSQPNAKISEKMIEWAIKQIQKKPQKDLVELYCGNGNFTIPLSEYFNQVLATEISKSGTKALKENIKLNQIENIKLARLSAEEFTQAFHQEREFNRLKNAHITLSDYQFSTILVDPPRSGIDQNTLKFMKNFDQILYISCNPKTLIDNLQILNTSHKIKSCALFDQFPYTDHIESGVFLQKDS